MDGFFRAPASETVSPVIIHLKLIIDNLMSWNDGLIWARGAALGFVRASWLMVHQGYTLRGRGSFPQTPGPSNQNKGEETLDESGQDQWLAPISILLFFHIS